MVIGKLGDVTVAAMQGRVHQYEGYTAKQAAFPVRVFGLMGLKAIILTNAAGGIDKSYGQGALVLLSDHINLQGANPLTGPNDDRFGLRFHDMTEAYSKRYRAIAHEEGKRLSIALYEGVYASLAGPSYETPAEIRYLRVIGADLVGMSTVPEVIIARHMGIHVLAISCVTNMAAGILDQPINHLEVLEVGAQVRGKFLALLGAVIPRIAAEEKQGS
jgi:purine-nucleoside phosphorylase